MLVRPSTAGMTERQGEIHAGAWPAILSREQWDAARTVLLDRSRDSRTLRQTARRYPLAGLLFCGLCGNRLVSNPLRRCRRSSAARPQQEVRPGPHPGRLRGAVPAGADTAARPGGTGVTRAGASPYRPQAAAGRPLRRPRRQVRLPAAERPPPQRAPRVAAGDVLATAAATDGDKRTVLKRALERVVVLPHPTGRATSHLDWWRSHTRRDLTCDVLRGLMVSIEPGTRQTAAHR